MPSFTSSARGAAVAALALVLLSGCATSQPTGTTDPTPSATADGGDASPSGVRVDELEVGDCLSYRPRVDPAPLVDGWEVFDVVDCDDAQGSVVLDVVDLDDVSTLEDAYREMTTECRDAFGDRRDDGRALEAHPPSATAWDEGLRTGICLDYPSPN